MGQSLPASERKCLIDSEKRQSENQLSLPVQHLW